MLCSVWNVLDFAAFFPPLLELALMYGANLPFRLGRFDLRWFKILRCVRLPSSARGHLKTLNLSGCHSVAVGLCSCCSQCAPMSTCIAGMGCTIWYYKMMLAGCRPS